jgi:hypothetical protein
MNKGYNVSSLLYYHKTGKKYFDGTCLPFSRHNPNAVTSILLNPVSWCNIDVERLVFMKWGGESMKTLGYVCEDTLNQMKRSLVTMTANDPSLSLIVPEVHKGAKLYDMHREWLEEIFRQTIPHVQQRSAKEVQDQKVKEVGGERREGV